MKDYDLQKMRRLLHDFYNLTNMKICIYDSAENELCYYPEKLTPFCKTLREDELADEKCRACDRRAFARQYHRIYRHRADTPERGQAAARKCRSAKAV